ncbi:hypothetical protein L218DRAFT_997816 [Marasmius fiardii PR-910]|nr:hypothetical protein L218DRAFT_997816 [Marasmius fiardii PR-910]
MIRGTSSVRHHEAAFELEKRFGDASRIRGPLHPDLNPNFVKKAAGSTPSKKSNIKDDEFSDAMSSNWDEGFSAGTLTGSFLELGERNESPPVSLEYEERERPPGRLSLLPEGSSDILEGRTYRFREREQSGESLDARSANKVVLEHMAPITSQTAQSTPENLTAKVTYRGFIREVRFQRRPTWLTLSDKIHTLFSIPHGEVAVSYIDAEGDEVTFSTQEELEAFYQDLYTGGRWKRGDIVSLMVWNLGSARWEKSSTTAPRSNTPKATLDADSIVSETISQDGRQASSHFSGPIESRFSHRSRLSRHSPVFVPTITSGGTPKTFDKDTSLRSPSNVSLPVSSEILIPPDVESIEVTEDRPMSSHDTPLVTKRKHPNPSLSSDIANLLSTLAEVVASHPELPENVRKILQNAVDGNYWTAAQRESTREAAGSIAESLTSLDKEGGKRVAEALGNLFRTVGQGVGTSPSKDIEPNTTPASEYVDGVTFTSASKNLGTSNARPTCRHTSDEWTRRSHGYQYGYEYGYDTYGSRTTKPQPELFDHKTPPPRIQCFYRDSVENPSSNPPSNLASAGRPSRRPSGQSNELRAQVEAAKLLYKAEKERYRAYKEDKQKKLREREQSLIEMFVNRSDASQAPPSKTKPIVPPFPPPPDPASLGQQNQPPTSSGYQRPPSSHEVTPKPSVPHPVRTLRRVSEPVGRRVIEQRSSSEVQIMKRIVKKLGDIGITTRTIPDLLTRVVTLLPFDITTMTVAKEEKIALTLVNELLKSRGIPSMVSGSGVHRP